MTTTWTFGGTALSTFGKVTLINDYLDLASKRGEDQLIPFRHGKIFTKKYYDARTLTFGIAVTASTATALETTFDNMRKLFSLQTQQVLTSTREDTTVRNAYASVNAPMDVQRISALIAKVIVEFTLPDPIFRLSTAIADNTTTIDADPKAMVVANPGTIEERDATITIDGPFTSITITNTTNGCTLTYTGSIGASENVVIQTNTTGEYTAILSTGSTNVIGNVTHSGASALMVFNTGNNTLSITSTGGDSTGTVKVGFYAPFL